MLVKVTNDQKLNEDIKNSLAASIAKVIQDTEIKVIQVDIVERTNSGKKIMIKQYLNTDDFR